MKDAAIDGAFAAGAFMAAIVTSLFVWFVSRRFKRWKFRRRLQNRN